MTAACQNGSSVGAGLLWPCETLGQPVGVVLAEVLACGGAIELPGKVMPGWVGSRKAGTLGTWSDRVPAVTCAGSGQDKNKKGCKCSIP